VKFLFTFVGQVSSFVTGQIPFNYNTGSLTLDLLVKQSLKLCDLKGKLFVNFGEM